ncbi:MAG: ADP-forming succinate--CoA ligase subunit beta [Candidatus Gastranaerophilales bacterium]|nr:ADP-forming succinate--CoA ligase subunit beta [Candidatus Gastranaerophilales bacterium]
MKIHEYQAKQLFKEFNIAVPKGFLADGYDEALKNIKDIGFPCVVKAQVHSGARGKAGGIKLARDISEFETHFNNILGMELKSIQTGDETKIVRKIWVEQGVNIDKELYLAITVNRNTEKIVIIASPSGGMDIEEVAEKSPEKIIKEDIDIIDGITADSLAKINACVGFDISAAVCNLYNLFVQKDCSLVEINPLVITKEAGVIAIDGKINFDDNALYKHSELLELRDLDEENPLEVEASKFNLNYIKLDGTIACMVNGAGLAMATMDLIKLSGKSPANFLDVGGGASKENIENAFRILLSDENVEAILINIFGGILRCDILAKGVKDAAQALDIKIPIIVRLEGTNKEKGAEILSNSGLKFFVAHNLDEISKALGEL